MKNLIFNSLRFRIFLVVISAALPLVLFFVYHASEDRDREKELLEDRAIELVDFTLTEESQTIDAARQLLISISSLPNQFFADPSLCSNYLADLLMKYKRYTNLGVVDENGILFASARQQEEKLDYSKAEFFNEVISNNSFAVGEYSIDPISRKKIINLGYPITVRWKKTRAVVFASLDVSYIDELEKSLTKIFPKKSLFLKINNEGDILASNLPSFEFAKNLIRPSFVSEVINRENGMVEDDGPGNKRYLYVFAVAGSSLFQQKLYLIVGVEKEYFFAGINEALLKNLFLIGLLFALILAATLLLSSKYILNNIKKLIAAAREMSGGNLSIRSNVNYSSGELGLLAKTFDRMVVSLEQKGIEKDKVVSQLRESEELFSTAFHSSPIATAIYRMTDGYIIDVNNAFINTFGYTQDEVVRRTTYELDLFADPQDRERIMGILKQQNSLVNFELGVHTKSGEIRTVLISANPIELYGEKHFLAEMVDITDHLHAEKQIRFQATLLSQVTNGVAVADLDGKLIYWNHYAEILHGWKAEEILGKYAIDFLVPKEHRGTAMEIFNSIFTKESADIEIPLMKKNGEEFPALVSYTLLKNESGEPIGILGISNDITERKLAEKKILVANERLRFLVYNNPAVIFTCKASGDFDVTYISENIAPRLGYTPEEFLNDPNFWQNHIYPDDVQFVLNAMSDISVNDNHILEYRFLHKDGTYRWIHDESKVVRDEKGNPLELIGYWVDITEIKQAEKELKEAHDLFLKTVSSLNDAIFLVDPGTRLIYNCNPAAEKIFGYARDEIIGRTTRIMYADKTMYEEFGHKMNRSLSEKGFFQTEYKLKRKNGETFPSEHYVRPLLDTDGKVIMVLSLVRDITSRKKAQELIKYQSALFENVHDAILATDKGFRITAWNLAAEELYGWKKNEVMGRVVHEIIPSDFSKKERERALKLLNDGKFFSCEVLQYKKDGSPIYVEGTTMPLYDEHNNLTGYVSMSRDISERIKIEKEKEKLLSEVQNTSNQLKTLSSRLLEIQETERKNIARELHDEIGQTLTAIKLNLQSIQNLSKSVKVQNVLLESIDFADKTLQQVRNLSLNLHPSMLDDLGLVPTIKWFAKKIADLNKLKINFTTEPKELSVPKNIEITCYRIVQEALTNIAKHSHAKNVSILLAREEKSVNLRITDDGTGFDVDLARRKAVKGKSLGILSMEERANLSNGSFTIESSPHKGTVINVLFHLN